MVLISTQSNTLINLLKRWNTLTRISAKAMNRWMLIDDALYIKDVSFFHPLNGYQNKEVAVSKTGFVCLSVYGERVVTFNEKELDKAFELIVKYKIGSCNISDNIIIVRMKNYFYIMDKSHSTFFMYPTDMICKLQKAFIKAKSVLKLNQTQ